ncbi:tapasin-related protein isoform X1 [Electrophorus electricus]|uniref:tapasin-related protein isoform X1 n=1 Tax=Electrophorus electricus TaxID=8005 RepID=UPI0015D0C890|nr:tapasin-related protein isoform X1 [Electrophorus electricus]
MLKIIIFGCLNALAHGLEGADVVLSCSLIEEGGGMGGMMGGSHFTRTPATLVLRDLPMNSDLSSETITPYNPPDTPNADDLIFEVIVSSFEIPEAESLLHADCNEQQVICELSQYVPRGTNPDSLASYFIGSIHLEGGGISFTLVLQTTSNENEKAPLIQSKLNLPLSQWGTLLTDAVFVVYSRSPSVVASIGDDVILDCGYKQRDTPSDQNVGLEWRWQHRGNGRKILDMKAQRLETEGGTQVHVERDGINADSALLLRDGNASLTMKELKVSDEGTYICTISSAGFQTQQIIQLHLMQAPRVLLNEKNVIFQDELPKKLNCHCERYFPLDVKVEWFSQPPTQTESISLTEKASLSSHQQHSDGTFSLTSFLVIRPSEQPPGTVLTCRVSHFALQTPKDISLTVETLEPAGEYNWMVLATLVLSILFLYQALSRY